MKNVGNVYMSIDYNKFSFEPKNRPIDQHNVSRIMQAMDNDFLITVALCYLDNDRIIIRDGQHRYEACRILKKPYYFCLIDEISHKRVVNSSVGLSSLQVTQRWKPSDWVHFYAESGVESFKIMKEFMENTGLPSIASHICLTALTGVAMGSKFFKGNVVIKDLERAYRLADIVNKFKDLGMRGSTNPRFVSALFKTLMRHEVELNKLYNGVKKGVSAGWIGSSVTTTISNLKDYCTKDRGLQKRHIDYKNKEWPYSV